MFTKQEASQLKQQFWTSFGQYMAPVPGAGGLKVNWVNYKTGVKDVHFKMDAGTSFASIAIVFAHADANRQALFFNLLQQLKTLFTDALQEEWEWVLHETDENGKLSSRLYTTLNSVNIFRQSDWPAIISFLKARIIALDSFWNEVKFSFETL